MVTKAWCAAPPVRFNGHRVLAAFDDEAVTSDAGTVLLRTIGLIKHP
jgi:hypothetical protein